MRDGRRRKAVWGLGARAVAAAVAMGAAAGCGDVVREGQSPAYLQVIDLSASSGAEPDKFGGTLYSDVITVKDEKAGIFSDLGKVTLKLAFKDPGTASNPTQPTQANAITIERYRVRYTRADGHNQQGVDVPYGFDAGLTFTITRDTATSPGFEIVRHIAKQEAPLAALASSPVIINTIAEVTFYGHDATGNEVSTTGYVGINFGNFADPQS